MPKIKTREKVQGIKTLDKAAVAGERMKEVYIRSKEQFTNLTDDRSENPNAYAGDKVQRAAENAAEDTARVAAAGAKLAVKQRQSSSAGNDMRNRCRSRRCPISHGVKMTSHLRNNRNGRLQFVHNK